MKELDEKGFVFVSNGCAYRCCRWGDQALLFRWRDCEHCWESLRPVTQNDIWTFPHNLTDEQQEHYFRLEQKTIDQLMPKRD